jgi:hypothetical protein
LVCVIETTREDIENMLKIQRNNNVVIATFTTKAGYVYDFQNVGIWFSKLVKSRLEDLGYTGVDTKVFCASGKRRFYVAVGRCFKKEFFNNHLDQLMDNFDDESITSEQANELLEKSKKLLEIIIKEVESVFTPFSVEDDETEDEIYVGITFSITSDDAGNLKFFLGESPTLGFFDFLNQAVSRIVDNASIWAESTIWEEGGAVCTRTPSDSYTHKKLYEAYLNASKSCTEQSADELVKEIKFYLQDLKLDAQEILDDDDWIITVTI